MLERNRRPREAHVELMTGFGLASAAGLNAYIPLLSMGLLDRYTNLVHRRVWARPSR